ncbi:hypothetical protein C8N35_103128 [Breoghania corrubedonensis]|uniref:Uncharacterized protein n=1 Tax=Breoghania corrubedonensis TaxID=665038 RepID=A0A2T5VB26_9HYPH|nr:hypothetical protein [Breoghania corrubedonensis]PTW60947.1 hypothetical protein C8N35_103128 [Breoghania corrubedonensis]
MATMKPSLTLVENEVAGPQEEATNAFVVPGAIPGTTHLDNRLEAMRRMLESVPHASAAEALAMLRQAFPDADLSDRVRALGSRQEA